MVYVISNVITYISTKYLSIRKEITFRHPLNLESLVLIQKNKCYTQDNTLTDTRENSSV